MSVAICVPYRGGDPHRDRAWGWVNAYYAHHHPDWGLVAADAPGVFSRARSLNRAAEMAGANVLVLADADCVVKPESLRRAVKTATWARPYNRLRRLGPGETEQVLTSPVEKPALRPGRSAYSGGTGGLVVIRREIFERVGGFDERFEGWGAEDNALSIALGREVGGPAVIPGNLWHLFHPRPAARKMTAAYRRNVEILQEVKNG